MTSSVTHRHRALAVLLAVVALLAAACGGEPDDPGTALAEAFEATFDDAFAYELTVDADSGVLTDLAEDQGQVAALIGGMALDGVVDEGVGSLRIRGLGSTLLELRSLDDGEVLYARLGIQDLLAMAAGGDVDPAQLLAFAAPDLPEDARQALEAAIGGQWLAIEGGFDDAVAGTTDTSTEEARALLDDLTGGDVGGFIERYVTVDGEDRGDAIRTIEVAFELREFLRATAALGDEVGVDDAAERDLEADLAELPERIPGVVTIRDGVVTELRFGLDGPMREAGASIDGRLDVLIELSDHGAVAPVAAPEGALRVTSEQLRGAFGALGSMGAGAMP